MSLPHYKKTMLALTIGIAAAMSGCSSNPKKDVVDTGPQSSEQVYIEKAKNALERHQYTDAAKHLEALETYYPTGSYAAQAQLESARAQLANASAMLARVRPLAKQNALSQKDLDDAIANERSAQAQVQSAVAVTGEVTGLSQQVAGNQACLHAVEHGVAAVQAQVTGLAERVGRFRVVVLR